MAPRRVTTYISRSWCLFHFSFLTVVCKGQASDGEKSRQHRSGPARPSYSRMARAVLSSSGDESRDGAPGEEGSLGEGHDSPSPSVASSSDADSSSSSSTRHPFELIDAEAQESLGGDDSDRGSHAGCDLPCSRRTFTLFPQLPPELRNRVWELFCPDLVTKARFLMFKLAPASIGFQPSASPGNDVGSNDGWEDGYSAQHFISHTRPNPCAVLWPSIKSRAKRA